ncbi:MAG: cytochrome c biogenesis protein ResB, partial [Clostridia bacterium]|nr:cytochrome c biogenesis protein ResB [Clostridia bacterium]
MPALKKIWKFISSMPFAIGVMGLLAAVCCLVSFITQGQSFAAYSAQYGERTAAVILALGLDDAFHSWWFVTLSAFLALSLFSCSAIRFPRILRRVRQIADIDPSATSDLSAAGIGDPQALFKSLGLPKGRTRTAPEGREFLVSVKNVAGYFGAWVCHMGLLLLILGFGLGQMTQKSYSVYGVPGQTKPIGDTGYDLRIESFDVQRRADGSVEQYTAGISVLNGDSA